MGLFRKKRRYFQLRTPDGTLIAEIGDSLSKTVFELFNKGALVLKEKNFVDSGKTNVYVATEGLKIGSTTSESTIYVWEGYYLRMMEE